MIRLSAFADEISPDLDEQVAVLRSEGIRNVELRGVWNTGVLDLSDTQVRSLRDRLDAEGIVVSAIGSPVGKAPADIPIGDVLSELGRAMDIAAMLTTSFIRVFSFYPPGSSVQTDAGQATVDRSTAGSQSSGDTTAWREEALERLRVMTEAAAAAGMTLLLENDVGLYGATVSGSATILQAVSDPHLAEVIDPANFIQAGEHPYPHAYDELRERLLSVHVKDVRNGAVVAAGEGEARFPELLKALHSTGYDGVFALEPHLGSAGQFRGFSGPERFRYAAARFKALLADLDWTWS